MYRGVDRFVRVGGGGILLSAYIQIFGYSPPKIQSTAILLVRMNWEGSSPYPPTPTSFVGVTEYPPKEDSIQTKSVYNCTTLNDLLQDSYSLHT